MSKEMLINVTEGEEIRIAVLNDARLDELYSERTGNESFVGNIYKGRVTNVEPSIQAAFVDFGQAKNGFLHISDLTPQYFGRRDKGQTEAVGKKRSRRDRPPIQDCLRRGQEVIVQVTKEGIGTKGPTLTSYLSIPGRYLVLMPGMSRLGVSRKIEDDEKRRAMRAIVEELKPPKDMGIIVRTAGIGRAKRDLNRDLNYLTRLWNLVSKRIKSDRCPADLYTESDLVTRTIRDVYSTDIQQIVVDNQRVLERVKDFLDIVTPRGSYKLVLYQGEMPLFHHRKVEEEIERINSRHVPMASGGSLVIDQTEALVAIDVNSGKYRQHRDAEITSLKINQEAAAEIARQLRLRDLGGEIVIDFIDMRQDKNMRAVEKALRDAMKHDRARSKILRISRFCIVEMTRQRLRPSRHQSNYMSCSHCRGTGLIKTPESLVLDVMRRLQIAIARTTIALVNLQVPVAVAHELFNRKRKSITDLESRSEKKVTFKIDPTLPEDQVVFHCTDARGAVVEFNEYELARD